jgi:thiaminase
VTGPVTVLTLAARDPAAWRAATQHAFLVGAGDGTLPAAVFDRWLEQDRHFVEALARAWAIVLAAAPAEDLGLLAEGIAAFVAEVAWFDDIAVDRALRRPAPVRPETDAYRAHLARMATAPYSAALVTMWVVEAAYLEGWRGARPGAERYRAFVEHWTDDGFASFVDRLGAAADRALAGASPTEVEAAHDALLATARHEAAFWAMTMPGAP